MKRLFLLVSFFVLSKTFGQTWTTEEQYIQQFAKYAVEEMEKYKIPASITLAQGLLETGGGQSRLAREGNNHFGIKCKAEWTGRSMKHTDDAPNECFRVYDSPRDSYEDHSKFLAFRKHYQNLFKLDPKDYKAWAHGLKRAGYATNPRYAYILISKIEKHKLYEFDNIAAKEVKYTLQKLYPNVDYKEETIAEATPKTNTPPKKEINPFNSSPIQASQPSIKKEKTADRDLLATISVKNHPNGDRKYIIIPEETTVDFISEKFGVRKARLIKYNELGTDLLRKNDIIFLESKAGSGNIKTYKSKGETMHQIAQKFAIKLKKLYRKNDMEYGSQPKYGQIIKLK